MAAKAPLSSDAWGAVVAVAIVVAVLSLVTDWSPPWRNRWLGWVYPDRSDLLRDIPLGGFSSFEECQARALEVLSEVRALGRGSYECGLDCDYDEQLGIHVCKETRP